MNPSWILEFHQLWIYFSLSQQKHCSWALAYLFCNYISASDIYSFTSLWSWLLASAWGIYVSRLGLTKVARFNQGFSISLSLEIMRISWIKNHLEFGLRPLGNAAYVAFLPLLCQGSHSSLMRKSVPTSIQNRTSV